MSLRSKLSLPFSLLFISLLLSACGNSTSSEDQTNFDRSEMLNNYGNNIIIPAFENMQAAANELETAAKNFENERTIEQLETLQTNLKDARLAWQDIGPFLQFGPAESIFLRPSLNTYPTDTVKINENISTGDYSMGYNNRQAAGLPALGYLLHGVGNSNEEIVAMYTSDAEAENRINYLLDNVTFIKEQISKTTSEWQASGGNYIGMFTSDANAGTDVGSSLGMVVNALVLHYERYLRDGKIGIPSGVRSDGIPRPSSTEAYYGGYSLELAIASLEAVKQLYLGTTPNGSDGPGLQENLQALGAEELSTDITSQLDNAKTLLEGLSDPLSDQIVNNNDPVLETFQEMQKLVALFKADMSSILGVTITYQDNDGD